MYISSSAVTQWSEFESCYRGQNIDLIVSLHIVPVHSAVLINYNGYLVQLWVVFVGMVFGH